MLKPVDESPLWGVIPYRVVVPALLALALILTALLVASLERWHSALSEALLLGSHPEDIPHADLIKLAFMAVLLGGTAIASLSILQHYRNTQRDLSRVQVLSRDILENMVRGIVTFDLGGEITVANSSSRQMLELPSDGSPQNLAGLRAHHPELGNLIQTAIERDNYVQDVDIQHLAPSKGKIWLRVTTWPLVVGRQQKAGVVVLLKDVTRVLTIEKQLRRLDRLAATETLAAGVAHEIRNPLTAIDLNLRLLRDEVLPQARNPAEIDAYFEILTEETGRLNRITEEFLVFSRPTALPKRNFSIAEVAAHVLRLIESEGREKNIRFDQSIAPDLPMVCGDPERLEQVFLNLFVNAMQAMPQGGVIQILAESTRSGGEVAVEVSITDQGPGVPEQHLSRLFDPYFTTKPEGTGLGLAIAHRIVTDHEGDITVENAPSGGATVKISLPAAPSQPSDGWNEVHESQSVSRG